MYLATEKNKINNELKSQKNRVDNEAKILNEFINTKCPYKPGTEESLNFWEKRRKTYCKKLGEITLHELYHKINILIGRVDSNTYAYTLRMISDLNNMGFDGFNLSIAHNNLSGNQKYTYLICSQDYELKNLNEVLGFIDAELYETSDRHHKILYKLIIKDKEKEKQLYQDEINYKMRIKESD